MSGFKDRMRGKAEKTVGGLVGDKKLQRRAERDEAVGKLKDAADDVRDSAKHRLDDLRHKVEDRLDDARPDA